jgi:hypothetical protein
MPHVSDAPVSVSISADDAAGCQKYTIKGISGRWVCIHWKKGASNWVGLANKKTIISRIQLKKLEKNGVV